MPDNCKVLFFGATGMAGRLVFRKLMENRHDVTAFARNTNKAFKVLPKGSKIIRGNLKFRHDIESVLKEFNVLFLCLSADYNPSAFQPEYHGVRNILLTAERCNIKRIIYVSALHSKRTNSDWWAFDIKRNTVKIIKDSGIPYTIFYPSCFMNTIPEKLLKNYRIHIPKNKEAKQFWIAAEDFADMAAVSFKNQTADNKEYDMQGETAYSLSEAAEMFLQNIPDKNYSIRKIRPSILRLPLVTDAKIRFYGDYLRTVSEQIELFTSSETWSELRKPAINFHKFASEYRAGK